MPTLHYQISHNSVTHQTLKVEATLSSLLKDEMKLFKGKVKLLDFECNCPYAESGPYILIQTCKDPIHISYTAHIHTPGKHGFYGGAYQSLTVFAGEQVFLFPLQLMTLGDFAASAADWSVEITYDFPMHASAVVPFKNTATSSLCQSPRWCIVYELLKSAYVFGDLVRLVPTKQEPSTLHLYTRSNLETLTPDTVQNIEKLFKYYAELFSSPSHTLNLILLDDSYTSILGGCGRHVICYSFDQNALRDWQLLSHRLFHSFMDIALPLSDFHMPPNLWLTEGLATYYENVALDALSEPFKEKLNLHIPKEFNRLYTRYLYAKLKGSAHFAFPPMAEKSIRSAGRLEFLHYTHAPLVVKYIEDTFTLPPEQPHKMLRTLLALGTKDPFSLQKFFMLVLGERLDDFAQRYLFADELLTLWYLSDTNFFTPEELLADLNDFEYMLYSWLVLEDPAYKPAKLSYMNLEAHCAMAEQQGLFFAPSPIEEQVEKYSMSLYQVLKWQCSSHC